MSSETAVAANWLRSTAAVEIGAYAVAGGRGEWEALAVDEREGVCADVLKVLVAVSESLPADRNLKSFLSLKGTCADEASAFRSAANHVSRDAAIGLLAKAEVLEEIAALLGSESHEGITEAEAEYAELETVDPETDPRFADFEKGGHR